MVTAISSTYLERQFATYTVDWAAVAAVGHPLSGGELEQRLAYGLQLYRLAEDDFAAVGTELAAVGRAYDIDAARYTGRLLTTWMQASTIALRHLDAFEAAGGHARSAAPFRRAVADVGVSMTIPVERAAAQAERIARQGHTRGMTTEDLRRELQRRVGT